MASTNYRWNFDPWSLKCEEMKPMYLKGVQKGKPDLAKKGKKGGTGNPAHNKPLKRF